MEDEDKAEEVLEEANESDPFDPDPPEPRCAARRFPPR